MISKHTWPKSKTPFTVMFFNYLVIFDFRRGGHFETTALDRNQTECNFRYVKYIFHNKKGCTEVDKNYMG